MSTDIGALQKQYKTLQKKQHHACVVLSGIGQKKCSNSAPNSPEGSGEDSDFLNTSMALMTLSVNTDTDKGHTDTTTDAVSPVAFGKAKCIFIQNNSKKPPNKHKERHDKRERRRRVTETVDGERDNAELISNEKEGMSEKHEEDLKVDKSADSEHIREEMKGPNTDNCGESVNDGDGDNVNSLCEGNEDTYCVTGEHSEIIDKCSNVKDNIDVGGVDNRSKSKIDIDNGCAIDDDTKTENAEYTMKNEGTIHVENRPDTKCKSALEVKGENSVHVSNENENNGRGFYKPFYPMKIIKPPSRRYNSVKMSNKQSIYQHFTMTKRQLSLDSALEDCNHSNSNNNAIDFPFPVHSINQHKIQAGMKLGLYDQHALEKLETLKPRKSARKRLPSLNVE